MRRTRLWVRASIVLSCTMLSAGVGEKVARAEATLADKAAAQTLFDEGRKLMAAGKFGEACPKLAESQKLDPGVGTQFNLADCYERVGQTASAWTVFLEAASAAKSMGQTDREKVAKERAATLAPRLSKLTITSPEAASLAGLEIKRDGTPVGRALWGTAVPVDPGSHVIDASAPGKKPWRSSVTVEGEKASVVVTVPALQDAPPEAPTSAAVSADVVAPTSGSGRRTLGLVVGGAGVVGLGIGTAFALKAKSNYDESLRFCAAGDNNRCNQDGITRREDARSAGNIATLVVGAGAAAVVAGAVLFLTAPSSADRPRAMLVPTVGPEAAGFTLVGMY